MYAADYRQQFFTSASRRWFVGPLPLRDFTLIRDSVSLPRPPILATVVSLFFGSLLLSSVACRNSTFQILKSLNIELFISMDPAAHRLAQKHKWVGLMQNMPGKK
ncbi:uncharacterized protein LOC107641668 [Arachis ipaensis]|uniref:uncharacterized protein LOC107641668 n=1 Tax=Arachis ipaensis TaxID=130454 RepID=UPI0007AFC979|nr:uncharacterized protein LOC107641668 [Arachis ipaensis]